MCGIAGIILKRRDGVDSARLRQISQALRHRGPDDEGFLGWTDSQGAVATRDSSLIEGSRVAFVHRRLAILDLSECGWQPMQSEDRMHSIVFNGEIYNYVELRQELEKIGHVFRSQSDTEVLLKAYIQWGSQVLSKLVGMFAFAILDLRRELVFLARDFFGIKPLYYFQSEESFAFASETNTLLEFPGVGRRVNSERLVPYLRFGLTDYGEQTLWRDIRQLPSAHYLEIPLHSRTGLSPQRYWSLPPYAPQKIGYDEATIRLRDMFLDSVRLHLRSDVPVGACLSGGLDSSAIVMSMRRLLGQTGEIHTFSHLASEESLNEKRWADIVVGAAGTKPHYTRPSESNLLDSLEDMVRFQGEPFGSTSIFAQYKVFEQAGQEGLKVMLDGQGADEMLGGYWGFLSARIASLLAHWRLVQAGLLFLRGCGSQDINRANVAQMAGGMLLPIWMQNVGRKLIKRELLPLWFNRSWVRRQGLHFAVPWGCRGPHYLRFQLEEALGTVPLPMLLRYEDRNSMRFSIESRVPFLTHHMAEFLLSLPEDYIVDQKGMRKSVFRSAMRGLVPDAILDRRDKIGFAAPELKWMRSLAPWVDRILGSDAAHAIPALNLTEVKSVWQRVLSGQLDNSSLVWRWINLIEWTRLFNAEYDS